MKEQLQYDPGSVFQINEKHGRIGWIGAFVLSTEIRDWGIIGYVHSIIEHEKAGQVWIRLKWDEIDYIGEAVLVLADKETKNGEK